MQEVTPEYESVPTVIEEPEIQEFIQQRSIRPEGFFTIEELAKFPNDFIIMWLHHHFNTHHERSAARLERLTEMMNNEDAKQSYGLFLEFTKKYPWTTCWNLVGVLENRKQEPGLSYKWERRKKQQQYETNSI